MGSGTGYYVLAGTRDRDVYLCLDNDYDASSTVRPTHVSYGTPRETDGYVWKYLYTISDATFNTFATTNVIPVGTNSTVSSYAKAGSIIAVPLSANSENGIGEYYRGDGFSNGTQDIALTGHSIATAIPSDAATSEVVLTACLLYTSPSPRD